MVRVPAQSPHIDEYSRSCWDVVAVDVAVFGGFADDHWSSWVETESFFYDCLKVWEIWDVGFLDQSGWPDD